MSLEFYFRFFHFFYGFGNLQLSRFVTNLLLLSSELIILNILHDKRISVVFLLCCEYGVVSVEGAGETLWEESLLLFQLWLVVVVWILPEEPAPPTGPELSSVTLQPWPGGNFSAALLTGKPDSVCLLESLQMLRVPRVPGSRCALTARGSYRLHSGRQPVVCPASPDWLWPTSQWTVLSSSLTAPSPGRFEAF